MSDPVAIMSVERDMSQNRGSRMRKILPKQFRQLSIALFFLLAGGHSALAQSYERGLSAYNRADYETALREWDALAQFGDPQAQFGLGLMHTFGHGVPEDDIVAMDWYARAAKRGHPGAQLFLGHGYETGNGVARDPETAFLWYLAAAEHGLGRAQNNLGRLYETGTGVEADLDIAIYWYEESARNGNANARKNLARLSQNATNPE